jgi:hypothetical protein
VTALIPQGVAAQFVPRPRPPPQQQQQQQQQQPQPQPQHQRFAGVPAQMMPQPSMAPFTVPPAPTTTVAPWSQGLPLGPASAQGLQLQGLAGATMAPQPPFATPAMAYSGPPGAETQAAGQPGPVRPPTINTIRNDIQRLRQTPMAQISEQDVQLFVRLMARQEERSRQAKPAAEVPVIDVSAEQRQAMQAAAKDMCERFSDVNMAIYARAVATRNGAEVARVVGMVSYTCFLIFCKRGYC